MSVQEQFKKSAELIENRHYWYFLDLPADSRFKSIHAHYYIFSNADGAHLRFQSDSDLPDEIRNDLLEAFDNFIGQ